MQQDQLTEQRELTELLLAALAEARRKRRAVEAERDAATAEAKALLAELAEPFAGPLGELEATEEKALAEAVEAVASYDAARRLQLLQGIETPQPARPDGVKVKWLETPTVADITLLPERFRIETADMKAIKLALKAKETIQGVENVRKPSITVGADPVGAEQ